MYLNKLVVLAGLMSSGTAFRVIVLSFGLVVWLVYGDDAVLAYFGGLCLIAAFWKLFQIGGYYTRNEPYPYRIFGTAVALGFTVIGVFWWFGVALEPMGAVFATFSIVFYFAGHLYYGRKIRRS